MSASPVYAAALRYGGILTACIAVVGSIVGYAVGGPAGLLSALLGAVMAAIFMGLSALSMIIAGRIAPKGAVDPIYFAVILGAFGLKMVAFLVITLVLRGQPWLSPYLYFATVVVAVIGSLVADGLALQRTRVSYVGDVALPEDAEAADGPREGSS